MPDVERELGQPEAAAARGSGSGAAAARPGPERGHRGAAASRWELLHHGGVLLALAAAACLAAALLAAAALGRGPAAGSPRLAVGAALALGLALAAGGVRLRRWRAGLWRDLSVAPARLLLYCALGAWAGLVLLGAPVGPSRLTGAAVIALAAFSVAMLTPPLPAHGRVQRIVRGLDLFLLNLCVLLVAGEIGLRAVASLRPSVLLTRPDAGIEESLEAARYPAGTVRHGFPVNSGGHYDEEFVPKRPGRRLVICIGDSFSAGVVHHSFHFTTVAERLLDGVAVYNMGLPAIDIPHYQLLLAREALPLKPDAVVVDLFVGNDLSWPLPAPSAGAGLKGLLDAANLLVLQVPRRLLILSRQGRRARQALEDRAGTSDEAGVLRTRKEILERYPWYEDPVAEPPTLDRESYLTVERRRAAQLCQQPRDGFALRLKRLEDMRMAARGVPLAVMIIPDVFQVEDSLWSVVAPAGATRARRMRSVAITRGWLEERGFAYLDLLPVLRAVRPLADGEPHLYKLNDTHFNARGNAVVGRALADFLKRWPPDP
jgi:hypothetical protein